MSEFVQILLVELNGRHNAYSGERNICRMMGTNVSEEESVAFLQKLFKGLTKPGYVLVKHRGNLYLCEENKKNKERGYDRTLITYHPLANQFA